MKQLTGNKFDIGTGATGDNNTISWTKIGQYTPLGVGGGDIK